MNISKEMILEANEVEIKASSDFEKLSFYAELMDTIDREYSNDEIESLAWILKELARNVEYNTISNRLLLKHKIIVELTKDNRRNNVYLSVIAISYLPLSNGAHKNISSNILRSTSKLIPFYKGNLDSIKEIHKEFDILSDAYNIINREEGISTIEELTKCKRSVLNLS